MKDQAHEIDSFLRVGQVAVLHLHSAKASRPRHKTFIRGWHSPHHIILDRPEVNDRFVPLRNGQPCVLRFLVQGKACGLESMMLDWDSRQRPKAYCRIAWPQHVEIVSFRKFQRVDAASHTGWSVA